MKDLMNLFIDGMVKGMQEEGAIYKGRIGNNIYFDIPKGSSIDDMSKLKRVSSGFKALDLQVKVKKV